MKPIMLVITALVGVWSASAQSVNLYYSPNGDVTINWDAHPCAVNGYDVYLNVGAPVILDHQGETSATNFNLGQLVQGVLYTATVTYYGKDPRKNCSGWLNLNKERLIGDVQFVYDNPLIETYPVTITSESKRLRNISTGQCLYTFPGTTVANSTTRNWGCWEDPNMAFHIVPTATAGEVKLKSQWMNVCIEPDNNLDGGSIGVASCSSSNAIYIMDFVNGTDFRLRNKNNGKCLYTTDIDGDVAHQWGCWNDPGMLFKLDSY